MNFAKAVFQASYGLSSQLPALDRPEIVFSGRSNVGKSSLINKLCNRKSLARVSGVPGKTATINFTRWTACISSICRGYGYAKVGRQERRRWDELINSYFAASAMWRCWCSCLTSGTTPAPTTARCWNICAITASRSSRR